MASQPGSVTVFAMPPRRRKFGPSQKERIFFAAVPDEAAAARICAMAEKLKAQHGFTGTLILPEHLHVTLYHLGDWHALPTEIVKAASEAAANVTSPPAEVTFTRTESFRNSTGVFPFVMTGDKQWTAWRPLYTALGVALTKAGLGGATKGEFQPHVTLVYDEIRCKPAPIAPPISWTVRDFVLIHSVLGKTTHHHLGRWPLKP
ncbi:MAG: 2'-5' RNA ligase family protein [Alphaproteobacteria bacterium]|nr:2'-5' RNA ligase family protein [Alphaproteobacteria bacterium]